MGVVVAAPHVRQARAKRFRFRLPYADTQNIYDRCMFTRLGAGHVCLNLPPNSNTGLWDTAAYGHGAPLTADTFTEYLNKSKNYTFYPYDAARRELDAAGTSLYMYVCVYVCIYIYIHSLYLYIYIYIHTYIHTYIEIMYAYVYTYIHTYINIYISKLHLLPL